MRRISHFWIKFQQNFDVLLTFNGLFDVYELRRFTADAENVVKVTPLYGRHGQCRKSDANLDVLFDKISFFVQNFAEFCKTSAEFGGIFLQNFAKNLRRIPTCVISEYNSIYRQFNAIYRPPGKQERLQLTNSHELTKKPTKVDQW